MNDSSSTKPDIRRETVQQLLTKREAADALGVTERTLDNYRSKGLLRSVKLSRGVVRFDPADLQEFIQRSKAGGQER